MSMNIYEKLQTMRVALQDKQLKKSGFNKYGGYNYYELADFLPAINKLCLENKVANLVNFTQEGDKMVAILTLIDIAKPDDRLIFTSPMEGATLKGAHPIQNLGAVETYSRRYLYMAAFEIVEADTLDAAQNPKQQPRQQPRQQAPQQQAPRQQAPQQQQQPKPQAPKPQAPKPQAPQQQPQQAPKQQQAPQQQQAPKPQLSAENRITLNVTIKEYAEKAGTNIKNALQALNFAMGHDVASDADAAEAINILNEWLAKLQDAQQEG